MEKSLTSLKKEFEHLITSEGNTCVMEQKAFQREIMQLCQEVD